jgi:hypothetical protein
MLNNGKADLSGLMGDANTTITLRGVATWSETNWQTKEESLCSAEVKVDVKIGRLFHMLGARCGRGTSAKATLGNGLVRATRTGTITKTRVEANNNGE